MSCDWKKTAGSVPCLGRPWDEIMGDGLDRPLHRSAELNHAIGWSNEHAVGLRKGERNMTLMLSFVPKHIKPSGRYIVTSGRKA